MRLPDYQRVRDERGGFIREFENSLFIYTSVMSKAKADKAICDAGLKAQSVDSGMPVIFGRQDIKYVKCSDEHGVIDDPGNVLRLNEKLKPDTWPLRPHSQCLRLVCLCPERPRRGDLAGYSARDDPLVSNSC